MYVCICNAVTDGQINNALRSGCKDVAELSQQLGVGNCCGSCLPVAEELVENARSGSYGQSTQVQDHSEVFYSA